MAQQSPSDQPESEEYPPLTTSDVITHVSESAQLVPGHPWREAACWICHEAIDGYQLRICLLVACAVPPDDIGRLEDISFLIHAWHPVPSAADMNLMAHERTCLGCANPRCRVYVPN